MKYEWKKQEKQLYFPKNAPALAEVPAFKFFTLSGTGSPDTAAFQERVEALYTLSYAIRMMPKKGITPEGYFEYTVFPLEGIWDSAAGEELDKDKFIYTLMIRQPEFVTEELMIQARDNVKKKLAFLPEVSFAEICDGLCVQCMHIGSYDDEPGTFTVMEEFCKANGLLRTERQHREIYLSDPRKTAVEKMKTVLRYKVKKG